MIDTWENELDELIDKYYDFLKGRTSVITNTGTEWAVISTPFIGLFNDALEVYVKKENGRILLSDDGVTVKNLDLSGVTISRSPRRRDFLDKILLNYDIRFDGNELLTEATEKTFAQKKHNLISAISEINDMYLLSQSSVTSIFKEDVNAYLNEQNIIYTPQFISKGSTGLDFTFDFQIAYQTKEIVIKSFNSVNKANIPNFLFTWEDIKKARQQLTNKKVVSLAFINDGNKKVQEEYLNALQSRNADYILWSQRYDDNSIMKLKEAV